MKTRYENSVKDSSNTVIDMVAIIHPHRTKLTLVIIQFRMLISCVKNVPYYTQHHTIQHWSDCLLSWCDSVSAGWQWYYKRYIDVRKGGIGGISMLLAGYCVLSYVWSYPHLSESCLCLQIIRMTFSSLSETCILWNLILFSCCGIALYSLESHLQHAVSKRSNYLH